MARLASETKMGFYPTSILSIQKIIEKAIAFPENDKEIYALDCCAGEGEAIEMIGAEYGCKTFAVELDKNRAIKCEEKSIFKVLNADSLNGVRKSNTWVGLNFLNPPYDRSASGSRLEIDFVERWGLTTTIGGAMLLVINPSSADEDMAKALRIQGYRPMFSFYDPDNADYKNYGQFFVVLQREKPNFRASLEKFIGLFNNPMNINTSEDIEKIIIRNGSIPAMFKEIDIPRWKIEKSLSKSKLRKSFFGELRKSSLMTKSIENPNEGQSAILIASGVLNKELTLENGDRVILKGTSNKNEAQFLATAHNVEDSDKVKIVEVFKTVVYGLNLTHGQFVKYE